MQDIDCVCYFSSDFNAWLMRHISFFILNYLFVTIAAFDGYCQKLDNKYATAYAETIAADTGIGNKWIIVLNAKCEPDTSTDYFLIMPADELFYELSSKRHYSGKNAYEFLKNAMLTKATIVLSVEEQKDISFFLIKRERCSGNSYSTYELIERYFKGDYSSTDWQVQCACSYLFMTKYIMFKEDYSGRIVVGKYIYPSRKLDGMLEDGTYR